MSEASCEEWTFEVDNKMKNCVKCDKCRLKILFDFMLSPVNKKFCLISILIFLKLLPATTSHITPFDNIKLINENSTILLPLLNSTQNMTASAENSIANQPWWCRYSADLEENANESECHCEGPKLLKIPQNLPQISRLSIENAKFKVLREAGLKKYASSLKDLWVFLSWCLLALLTKCQFQGC